MRDTFDSRVISPEVVRFLRELGQRASFVLAGGAALSGAYLAHRLSKYVDLFCVNSETHRAVVAALPDAARAVGGTVRVAQDAGSFVRAELTHGSQVLDVDVVIDASPPAEAPSSVEGVQVQGLADLRASKLTCLVSRSEPRDLVDVLFLDRAGFAAELDLPLAAEKDTGVDPGVMAWLLGEFPVSPLPQMIAPLTTTELRAFRDQLRERLKRVATR